MSKYQPLWEYLAKNKQQEYTLSFAEIEKILGFGIDHAFLNYKKEAQVYGYEVGKISLKMKTVNFSKLGSEK